MSYAWFTDVILRKATGKLVADGWQEYMMVSVESGRAATIPDEIRRIYSIQT